MALSSPSPPASVLVLVSGKQSRPYEEGLLCRLHTALKADLKRTDTHTEEGEEGDERRRVGALHHVGPVSSSSLSATSNVLLELLSTLAHKQQKNIQEDEGDERQAQPPPPGDGRDVVVLVDFDGSPAALTESAATDAEPLREEHETARKEFVGALVTLLKQPSVVVVLSFAAVAGDGDDSQLFLADTAASAGAKFAAVSPLASVPHFHRAVAQARGSSVKPFECRFYCGTVLAGGLPNVAVALENEHVFAFHHTNPFWEEHVVLLPKTHIPSFAHLPVSLQDGGAITLALVAAAQEIARKLEARTGAARVYTNMGEYQAEKHLHWHIGAGKQLRDW